MSGRLAGPVATATCSTRGTGRAIALARVRERACPVAVDVLEEQGSAVGAKAATHGTGGRMPFVRADVSGEDGRSGTPTDARPTVPEEVAPPATALSRSTPASPRAGRG